MADGLGPGPFAGRHLEADLDVPAGGALEAVTGPCSCCSMRRYANNAARSSGALRRPLGRSTAPVAATARFHVRPGPPRHERRKFSMLVAGQPIGRLLCGREAEATPRRPGAVLHEP